MELLRNHAKEIDHLKKRTSELILNKGPMMEERSGEPDDDISLTTTKSLLCLSCGNIKRMRRKIETLYSPPHAHTTRSHSPLHQARDNKAPLGNEINKDSEVPVVSPIVRPSYMASMQGQKSEKAWMMFASKNDNISDRKDIQVLLGNLDFSVNKISNKRK